MRRYEATAGLGPSFFFGDIGGYSQTKNILGLKDITILQTRFDFNANFKYRLTQDINLRLSLTSGFLQATDVRGSNEGRGFEASTLIIEPALIGEYYFIKNKAENSYLFSKGKKTGFIGFIQSLDFYAFTGIGGLGYSVKGNARLENYGIKNGGFTAVIPVGIGSTLIYSPNFNFGVEVSGRYSFSDYLDGYSNIQYSRSNDVYYFLNFTITYKLKTGANGWPSFR
ncbi:MAG TPA: hypothetical protein VF346_02115 [Bacteroidales bacterium]